MADLQRLRAARRRARATVAEADARYMVERRAAFTRELAATVRFASPFLETLLTLEQLTLADVANRIEPLPGWPGMPLLPRASSSWENYGHVSTAPVTAQTYGFRAQKPKFHGIGVPLDGGGMAYVQIVGHSLEVRATTGTLVFETRFGELRITTAAAIPEALAAASVGRLVDEIVSHPAIDGRDWHVRDAEITSQGTKFFVTTGAVRWRLL